MITLGTVAFSVAAYVLIWNPIYNDVQNQIMTTTSSINDPYIQSQMLIIACGNYYRQVFWVFLQFL